MSTSPQSDTDKLAPRNTDPFCPPVYSVQDHVDALHYSGYTQVPQALPSNWLEPLRQLCSDVSRDYGDAYSAGLDHRTVGINHKADRLPNPYRVGMARCAYLWGPPVLDLLDLDIIHEIGSRCIHLYQLNDVAVNTAFPDTGRQAWGFHRDYPHHQVENDIRHLFLWFFFMLDDFTPENGATWVVPGTHRKRSGEVCHYDRIKGDSSTDAYPTKLQVTGKAGDLFIVDPNALHAQGINQTNQDRRAINVRLCYALGNDQCDHWAVAGELIQKRLSPRVATMLQTRQLGLPKTWPYYPPIYETL